MSYIVYTKTTTTNNTSPAIQASSSPSQQEKSRTIVAFGDSLTAGYGVALDESYPSILEKKLREQGFAIQVINMGVSGETSLGALQRLTFVAQQNPEIVLLGIGANDMLRGMPPDDLFRNIEEIVTFFQNKNITVVLLGMKSVSSNGEDYSKKFNAVYVDIAKKYNLSLVPFFLENVALNASLNIPDGIHPNKEGYEKIVKDTILPVLLPVLEGKR